MPEETLNAERYLSLKDVSKILNKKEAALRARIKRGNLAAIQLPMNVAKKDSGRFRYMIPFDAVKTELAGMVRQDPMLQMPLEDGEGPNLYQVFCEILSKRREGLRLNELRFHLERFYGLSLSEESVEEFLGLFSEFHVKEGIYTLQHAVDYSINVSKQTLREDDVRHVTSGEHTKTDAQESLRQLEQRINALESKIELLIQLLSKRFSS